MIEAGDLLTSIAAHANDRADALAVTCGDAQLVYADLLAAVESCTEELRSAGVGGGDLVVVEQERDIALVPRLLAIWSLGAAYVPIDPAYPEPRKDLMRSDCGARFSWSEQGLRHLAGDLATGEADGLAYVMYTSGSTGTPKGVAVTRQNVEALLSSLAQRLPVGPDCTFLSVTTLSFDISVLELFLPLYLGGSVVIAPRDVLLDRRAFEALIEEHDVNWVQATPSGYRLLVEAGWQGCSGLSLLCGGEALTPALARTLRDRCETLYNVYGPTETCVWSMCSEVTDTEHVVLGEALPGEEIFVLRDDLSAAGSGEAGEVWIAGSGVAQGYWRREALTAERFRTLPNGVRAYRTGDLARREATGELVHLGRIDRQVKIRGHRIELGEIEAAAEAVAGVDEALMPSPDEAALEALPPLAYRGTVDEQALSAVLGARLPAYMVPSVIIRVESIPRLPNGKADPKALAAVLTTRSASDDTSAESPGFIALREVLAPLLSVESFAPSDNFFALGGHSLLAARGLAQLRKIAPSLTLRQFFDAEDMAALSRFVEAEAPSAETESFAF